MCYGITYFLKAKDIKLDRKQEHGILEVGSSSDQEIRHDHIIDHILIQ